MAASASMAGEVPGAGRRGAANRAFKWVVGASLALHAGAIGAVLWTQGRTPRAAALTNSVPVQLVQLGKRRDPKLLPRKVEEAPARVAEAGVALDNGKAKDPERDPKRHDAPKKEPKLSDRARALLEGTASDARLDAAAGKLEEREGDPNGSEHGTTTDATNAATGYAAVVASFMRQHYELPKTIPSAQRAFLKAQVMLFVEADGSIARYEFVERHPNELFMGALESMLKQLKLPAPPPAAVAQFKAGVIIRFSP